MKYYCDTNFIVRYLISDDEKYFLKTKEIFQGVKKGNDSLILEQTVFTETVFVLSSFYKVPKDKIVEVLSELLIYKGVICGDKENLLLALDIYSKHNIHIVDSILIAKAEADEAPILTFDKKLREVKKSLNNAKDAGL